jgi:SAM-dependent methyltransferase
MNIGVRRSRAQPMSSVNQAGHYDRIIGAYDEHYYDEPSLAYRKEFILDPLLELLDLNGKRVADLACGSGRTSLELMERFPTVQMTGFDISPEACRRYHDATERPSHQFDLTQSFLAEEPFDAAVIMGGLHHCVSNLAAALNNVGRMVKPGGSLLLFEPNADYVLQFARRIWYRLDGYFDAETESALSHDALLGIAGSAFSCRRVRYFGGPAFFLVYNSLVFRIPRGIKGSVAPALLAMERAYNKLPGRWPYASFTAHWIRQRDAFE